MYIRSILFYPRELISEAGERVLEREREMGRYMKKSKAVGKVALFELTHAQSFSGVRTRAKTLALQRLRRSAEEACCGGDRGSYLQLRSRRLQKPPIGLDSRRQKSPPKESNSSPSPNSKQNQSTRPSSRLRQGCSANSVSVNKEEKECLDGVKKENFLPEKCGAFEGNENNVNNTAGDAADEASFGENLPEFEGRERWVYLGLHFSGVFFFPYSSICFLLL